MEKSNVMEKQPTYTLSLVSSRNIIKANPAGTWTEEAVYNYIDDILDKAKKFAKEKWAFMPDISKMAPIVDVKTSNAFKEFHVRLEAAGCIAFAFVVGSAIAIKTQAQKHQDTSSAQKLVINHFKPRKMP